MTNLSPAAQAVLNAYEAVPIVGMYSEYYDRLAVAAALRALDSQLGHEILGVRGVDCSQIQLIADELEGAQ